jgi:hypothetical protein
MKLQLAPLVTMVHQEVSFCSKILHKVTSMRTVKEMILWIKNTPFKIITEEGNSRILINSNNSKYLDLFKINNPVLIQWIPRLYLKN